jgi:DNA-binding MarR family transcriptional regulator
MAFMSDGTPWLDDEQQRIWRAFLRLNRDLDAALARDLQANSELSVADFEVLVNLTDVPEGRLRPSELASSMQWDRSRLSHHIKRMEARGLISREGCPEDGRGAFVGITPAGRAAIEQAAPGHVRAVRRMVVDALSPEEFAQLGALADKLLARITH